MASFRPLDSNVLSNGCDSRPIMRSAITSSPQIDFQTKDSMDLQSVCVKQVDDIPAVEVREVYYTYGQKKKLVTALRGINLTVPEGGMYVSLRHVSCHLS